MSYVTTATLVVDHAGAELRPAILAALGEELSPGRPGQAFLEVDAELGGGYKYPESDLFWAGFNYVSGRNLEDWFHALPWGASKGFLVWEENGEAYGFAAHDWTDL